MDLDEGGFGDLLHQAEQLTADIDSNGELPRVERNLRQILEVGNQLWNRTVQTTSKDATDVKASILLGSRGYDLPRVSSKLETLSVAKTFEPLESVCETDIQGFLRNERENAILSVIEESRKSTFEWAEKLHWESLESEWEQEKQRILTSLVGSGQDVLDIPLDTEISSADSLLLKTRSAMDNVEIAYARQVYVYNERVIQGGIKPNLAKAFLEVVTKLDDKNAIDLWTMVNCMVDVPLKISRDTLSARISAVMQHSFICQAKKYLEGQYVKFIKGSIYGNLQKAQLGGIPGIFQLVRSFLNIRLPTSTPGLEEIIVDGHPVWPMIYYCIRCGDLPSALEAANLAGQPLAEFTSFLTEYANSEEGRLNPSSENKIRMLYRRSVHTSTDPFKKAVYCIIGCCDVNEDHNEVADKVDDYLWLKLSQLRVDEDNDTAHQDRMSLSQLQTKLLEEYGESHFNAYQQPYLYFQVLFLTAQFEAAIEFLSRIERLRCHAVHVAITLYELNLLALPHSMHAQLLHRDNADKPPMRRLNFARLIMIYTRKFEATDPREALQYFYFLRDMKGIHGENVFMACVSELVRETREFEMLLGHLEKDGCRSPGLIDMFHGDTPKIIESVASDSESKGQFEDAVKLYDLAKNHEKVLELLNKLLSQVVSQSSTPQSHRDRLQAMAVDIARRYKSSDHTASRETTATFYLLLDLMTFFDNYHANDLHAALDIIQKLKLIPFRPEEVESRVNSFRMYADEVRRNLPDILLATMNILYSQYKTAKTTVSQSSTGIPDENDKEYATYLRKQAKALITFAGMISYRMPGDTNARLVQMEVLMN